ncbi:MAG: phosphopantetheine-binding protein [Syntrophales bacterium]|jgi:acyl carrier protein|nr:phosphopantetheine-binding protein [Syntrophales bacterium]
MPECNEDREQILRIAEIIIGELKLQDITPETFDPDMDLVDELGVDSMDLATVALVLQDEYGVAIDEDDYPTLRTVRLIAKYLCSKQAASGRKP